MIKTKVAFLDGRLFSSQLELFKNVSYCSDWLDKSRPSKIATFVLIMKTGYMCLKYAIILLTKLTMFATT